MKRNARLAHAALTRQLNRIALEVTGNKASAARLIASFENGRARGRRAEQFAAVATHIMQARDGLIAYV